MPHDKIPASKQTFNYAHLYEKKERQKSVYLITNHRAYSMISEYIRYIHDNNERIPVVIEVDLPPDIKYVQDEYYLNGEAIRIEITIPPEWIKRVIPIMNDEPIL